MPKVHLRPITKSNLKQCLNLQLSESQKALIATPEQSLAEAYVDSDLFPLAIYDVAAQAFDPTDLPVVGFTMYEITAGVGFIMRLMIDERHQGQGYAKAAMLEVIRRMRLHPEVEIIATSHLKHNTAASSLYKSLGFVPWDIAFAENHPTDTYLRLVASESQHNYSLQGM